MSDENSQRLCFQSNRISVPLAYLRNWIFVVRLMDGSAVHAATQNNTHILSRMHLINL